MNVLVVYSTKFGNTKRVAEIVGASMRPHHRVRVIDAEAAVDEFGTDVDLLVVGAPTQIHGWHLPGRRFLGGLRRRAFNGVAAATFDTRLAGPVTRTGAASRAIARKLEAEHCRLVIRPESFIVEESEGPLAEGEDIRARAWAREVLAAAAPVPA